MADVVEIAIAREAPETNWMVTFVNNETRSGSIENLGGGIFLLTRSNSGKEYYFSSEKVVFIKTA